MRPLVVLVTGDLVARAREAHGDYPSLIRAATNNSWPGPWLAVDCRTDAALPRPEACAGLIVTGSAASVTERAPWMRRAGEYLVEAITANTAVLGICFGHQLIAQALGGEVAKNPRGREMGSVELELVLDDPLLDGAPFVANMSHQDAVLRPPSGVTVLARSARDGCSALRFGDRAWGVQFHPEFDRDVMRWYIEARRASLVAEGLDPDALARDAGDALPGQRVLQRFAALTRRDA